MRPPDGFSGFSPDGDHQAQVADAMALLGRRSDLRDHLCIDPKPGKTRKDHWNVFNFRGSSGAFNQSPQLLLWVGSKVVAAKAVLPNAAPDRLCEVVPVFWTGR